VYSGIDFLYHFLSPSYEFCGDAHMMGILILTSLVG
jgi:hypothetical protein